MTLGFVFSVSAIILLGWPAGVIIAAGAPTLTHLVQRRPPLRAAYNGSMFALSALAAGLVVERIPSATVPQLVAQVVVCGVVYYWVVNLVLISAVLAASTGRSFFAIARENITQTAAPFAFMVSAALALVVLWQRQPVLSIALVGPLLAIALYQRSTFKAMQAMRLALTDPLTGLGNHRSFHERLQRELVRRGARRLVARPLPRRLRRPEERQRPLRTSRRRSRARPGGVAPAAGRRGVPARRRRVRGAPASAGRAAGDRRGALDRRTRRRARHRGRRRGDRQRRCRDVPDARLRTGRADPARRQRVVLGEEGRQEPRPRLRGGVDPAGRTSSRSRTRRTRRRSTGRRRAWRRRSTSATPTPGATRSASASTRRGSRAASARTTRRSS